MHRSLLGAALALAAPATPATAEPVAFAMTLEASFNCFGCGTTSGSLSGDVAAGAGGFRTGATVTGAFTSNEPAGASCVATGSAAGDLTSSDGYGTTFALTRVGASVLATFGDGSSASGTFAVTSPVGHPCGGPVTAVVTLSGGGQTDRFPDATGHVTIHRFPGTGAIFLAEPIAQNGVAWRCTDTTTGAIVRQGDVLASPNPGVECYPPSGYNPSCDRLYIGGYFAAHSATGSIETTARCGSAAISTTIASGAPGYRMSPVSGSLPLRCEIQESLSDPATTDYWTYCQVNV